MTQPLHAEGAATVAPPRLRRRGRVRRRRLRWLLAILGLLAGGVLATGVAAAMHYGPMLEEARAIRGELKALAATAAGVGLNMDRPALADLSTRVEAVRPRLERFSERMTDDPGIALARSIPPVGRQVEAAEALLVVGSDVLASAPDALTLGERYVAIKESHAADPAGRSAMTSLVELMATSQEEIDSIAARVAASRQAVDAIPADLVPELAELRDLLKERIDQYEPVLIAYADVDQVLPGILGWGDDRRYLVLAQDHLELRPSGGLIGTFGIVEFSQGGLKSKTFRNVSLIDHEPGHVYVEPPGPLKGHLIGDEAWQLADAGWDPDFRDAAQDALRLYELETGDHDIDGVIAITPLAIDEILEVTGPVEVEEYGVTVQPGQTAIRALEQVNPLQPRAGEDNKRFLDIFAGEVLNRAFALPADRWPALIERLGTAGRKRSAMAWLKDTEEQALFERLGWSGALREVPGDYLYVVDANVAPVSKLNLVVERSQTLDVDIDVLGNAHNDLRIQWTNHVDDEVGRPYAYLRRLQKEGIYGNFVRVLTPERSRLEEVEGGSFVALNQPELSGMEGPKAVFGNYVMVPAGTTTLRYAWTSPYPVETESDGGLYRLTVQKQPGTVGDRVELRISVPEGSEIVDHSPNLAIQGSTAILDGTLSEDIEIFLRYRYRQ